MENVQDNLSVIDYIRKNKVAVTKKGIEVFKVITQNKFSLQDIYFNEQPMLNTFQLRIFNTNRFIVGILPIGIEEFIELISVPDNSKSTAKELVTDKNIMLLHTGKQLANSNLLLVNKQYEQFLILCTNKEKIAILNNLVKIKHISDKEWYNILSYLVAISTTEEIEQLLKITAIQDKLNQIAEIYRDITDDYFINDMIHVEPLAENCPYRYRVLDTIEIAENKTSFEIKKEDVYFIYINEFEEYVFVKEKTIENENENNYLIDLTDEQ